MIQKDQDDLLSNMVPLSGISPVTKKFVNVRGRDATKFLNGLVTSRLLADVIKKKQHTLDINKHEDLTKIIDPKTNWGLMHEDIYDPSGSISVRRDGIYSMFLNSKGRVFNECFLYSKPFHNVENSFEEILSEPNYTIEIDPSYVSPLLSLLKLHKLSAKVKIQQEKSIFSYYYYNDTPEFDSHVDELQAQYFNTSTPRDALSASNRFMESGAIFNKHCASSIIGFAIDNRIPNFGIKFLTSRPIILSETDNNDGLEINEVFSDSFLQQFKSESIREEDIIRRRFLNGLFETQDSPPETSILPFEINLDYVNGLSLDKGCYVGQELTIRTFNNGVIRKRVLPVQFFEINDESLELVNSEETVSLNTNDDVISSLKLLNRATLSKLEIRPLVEPEIEETTSNSPSPFGNSSFRRSSPKHKRRSSSGKLLSVQDNLGFALLNLKDLSKTHLFKIELPCLENNGVKPVGLKVMIPEWWPED